MGYFEKIYRSDLSHRARAVYMYLKDRADSSGSCWPGSGGGSTYCRRCTAIS